METSVKPQGCTNLKLRQLDRVVTRHYDAYLSASGVKNTQYSLLSHVAALGPIRPSDLAQRMGLDASTLTRNLQPLVAQGWLKLGPGDDAPPGRDDDPKKAAENERKERQALEELRKGHIEHLDKP